MLFGRLRIVMGLSALHVHLMALSKRRRFKFGASDFFLLDLREEAATVARSDYAMASPS